MKSISKKCAQQTYLLNFADNKGNNNYYYGIRLRNNDRFFEWDF